MKKTILISTIAILIFLVPVLGQTCGDRVLEPGEYCDKDDTTGTIAWFDEIDACNKIDSDWIDKAGTNGLDCYPAGSPSECQLNITDCVDPTGTSAYCNSCKRCDNGESFNGNTCTQNECVNLCPGFGSCHYTPSNLINECSSCSSISNCEDYKNEFDCIGNVCIGQTAMLNKRCEWVSGTCKENLDCTWDCSNIYDWADANGDGFCNKLPGAACSLTDYKNEADCLANNPADNYPNQIVCTEFQENFPVFTSLNLFLSMFLLIGYYVIIARKKSR